MAGELILVVEDNDKNRKLVRDVLTAKGYRLAEAENGEDGVRLAREQHPDLVLMDIQLPGINGIEALRRLRADPDTAAIPVMLISVMPDEGRGRLLGAVEPRRADHVGRARGDALREPLEGGLGRGEVDHRVDLGLEAADDAGLVRDVDRRGDLDPGLPGQAGHRAAHSAAGAVDRDSHASVHRPPSTVRSPRGWRGPFRRPADFSCAFLQALEQQVHVDVLAERAKIYDGHGRPDVRADVVDRVDAGYSNRISR